MNQEEGKQSRSPSPSHRKKVSNLNDPCLEAPITPKKESQEVIDGYRGIEEIVSEIIDDSEGRPIRFQPHLKSYSQDIRLDPDQNEDDPIKEEED